MTRADRELIAPVDHAWLRMDQPTNAMVITSLLVFDGAPGFDAVRAFIRDRLLLAPRFRQRAVTSRVPLAPGRWEIDPSFDLNLHLHHVALPAPGGDRELAELISDIASTPLPHDRPLWQAYYVDGYDKGAALVTRLHHAMGDGVALVRMLLGIAEEAGGSAAEVGLDAPHPHGAVALAQHASAQALTLGRLLLLRADPATPLKAELGRTKRVLFSSGLSLARIKAAASRLDATTNDMLLNAITAALRQYLVSCHTEVDHLELRAMVPVYVKPSKKSSELGNHFGLVFVSLPIHIADSRRRLAEVVRRTRELKAQPDAVVALEVLAALGLATPALEQLAIGLFTRKASVMITNVPGPREPIRLAGKQVKSMVVWAPVSGHLGIGLSALTYAGELRLGIAADAALIREPELVLTAFEREMGALLDGPHEQDGVRRRIIGGLHS